MSGEHALSLASATVFLAIAVVAVLRRARSPLAIYLGLHCVGLFTYNALNVVSALTGEPAWGWVEDAAAALSLIPGVPLIVGFMGMRRRLRWLVRLVAAYLAALALGSVGAFALPALREFSGGGWWALAVIAGAVPGYGIVCFFLIRHALRSRAEERARCNLFLGAVLLGVGFSVTDFVAIAGLDVPRLSFIGLLAHSLLMAALVLKAPFFERVTVLTLVNAAVVAVLAVVAELVVFAFAGQRSALFVLGSVIVVLALTAALRPLWRTLAEQRARVTYHATLGRLAAQMSHDIRNPVAAIRGAAQFLQEERAQGRPLEPHTHFLDLIVERTARLERVLDDYQRMARVEPVFEPIDINRVVEGVLADRRTAEHNGVEIEAALAASLPKCTADADLLTYALENLVRNAIEAMPEGGTLTASTELAALEHGDTDVIRIRVQDTGEGMDARIREQALDEFFTTKGEGSGLGLAFATRVADAHGGHLRIESAPGEGTTVAVELPLRPGPA